MIVITQVDEVRSDVVPYTILKEYPEKTVFNNSNLSYK